MAGGFNSKEQLRKFVKDDDRFHIFWISNLGKKTIVEIFNWLGMPNPRMPHTFILRDCCGVDGCWRCDLIQKYRDNRKKLWLQEFSPLIEIPKRK
jgi:hypothetical protein